MSKHKTLLALGVAGALACGTSAAATFLCAQDTGASSISCAEIPPQVLDNMTSAESIWVPSPPFTTYYLVPLDRDAVALMEAEPGQRDGVTYHFVEPAGSSAIDLSAADQWEHSEPRTVTYLSTDEADAGNPGR